MRPVALAYPRFLRLSGRPLLLLSAWAMACPLQAEDADAASRAKIMRPVTLAVVRNLDFGTIVPSTTRASTVRVNLNDSANAAGGALVVGATHAATRISGQGTPNQVIIVTRPTTVWLVGPGPQMRARSWTLGTTSGLARIAANQYRISAASGNFTFRLGATLNIARNQPEGLYQGSYVVTVNYQ
jgi:hypothetical protein